MERPHTYRILEESVASGLHRLLYLYDFPAVFFWDGLAYRLEFEGPFYLEMVAEAFLVGSQLKLTPGSHIWRAAQPIHVGSPSGIIA